MAKKKKRQTDNYNTLDKRHKTSQNTQDTRHNVEN